MYVKATIDSSFVPVHWSTLVIPEGEVYFLSGEICFHKVGNRPQYEELVTARLVPYIVGGKVASHIDPIKLVRRCILFIMKPLYKVNIGNKWAMLKRTTSQHFLNAIDNES